MANQRIGNSAGVAALNNSNGTQRSNLNGSGLPDGEHWDSDYSSIAALRARLSSLDATFYTLQRLNTMTYNDLVYAVRVLDNPTTIK